MKLHEVFNSSQFKDALNDPSPYPQVLAVMGDPPTPNSECVIVEMDSECEISPEWKNCGYIGLLDFEDIALLWQGMSRKIMTDYQKAEFLIHYAKFDGQPGWFLELPNASAN